MCLNSATFKVFICENRKLPVLCLKHPLFQHVHMNLKWTAMRVFIFAEYARKEKERNEKNGAITNAVKFIR